MRGAWTGMQISRLIRKYAAMMHEDLHREEKLRLGGEREFGKVFAIFFALLAGFSWYRANLTTAIGFGAASAIVLVLAYSAPASLKWPNRVWIGLGLLLSKITQPIILGLLFFVVITPIGLIMRLRRSDLLRLKFDPSATTYWIARERQPNSMSKQF